MEMQDVSAFVHSVRNVFETMLQMSAQSQDPIVKPPGHPSFDVTGIIGMSGDVTGSVVLSFPIATAEGVVALMTGQSISHTDPDFADAVGELVNMIAGGAKAQMRDKKITITYPSVIIGSDHAVFGRKGATCVVLPCSCDCGDFTVEITTIEPTEAITDVAA